MKELLQLLAQWAILKWQILVRRVRVFWLTGSFQSHKEQMRKRQAEVHRRHLYVRGEEQRIERELQHASSRLRP